MIKHTPGPWIIHRCEDGSNEIYAIGSCTSDGDNILNVSESDARLIAAAPELLDALKAIVYGLCKEDEEGLIEHTEQITNARKAIAEAEGEA